MINQINNKVIGKVIDPNQVIGKNDQEEEGNNNNKMNSLLRV